MMYISAHMGRLFDAPEVEERLAMLNALKRGGVNQTVLQGILYVFTTLNYFSAICLIMCFELFEIQLFKQ